MGREPMRAYYRMPGCTVSPMEVQRFRTAMLRRTRRETLFPPFPWHLLWQFHISISGQPSLGMSVKLRVPFINAEWLLKPCGFHGKHWRGLAHRAYLRAYLVRRAMRKGN